MLKTIPLQPVVTDVFLALVAEEGNDILDLVPVAQFPPRISTPALINRINAHPATVSQIGNILAAQLAGGIT